MRDLRAVGGTPEGSDGLQYARVLELQRRGLLHVHALVIGRRFIPHETLRALAVRHGFGARVGVEAVRSAGAVAGYMAAQYLTKSHETLPGRYRVVQFSRGFPRDPERDAREARGQQLNAEDPIVAVIPDGMGWREWAEREIDAGRGWIGFDRTARARLHDPPEVFGLWE
jgi:hypothetical protein